MSKFKLSLKRLSLEFLGEEWKNCYLDFEPLSYREIGSLADFDLEDKSTKDVKASAEKVMTLLKNKFVSGKAIYKNGKESSLSRDELDDLPVNVITTAVSFLAGTEQKKS